MFYLQTGDIVPDVRIGPVWIGADRSGVTSVSEDFLLRHLPEYDLYIGGDIQIWLHRPTNRITQIMVYGSFAGKFAGRFGIGSYLCGIEDYLGETAEERLDTYMFRSAEGICFELNDIDDDWDGEEWFKANAPIACISVFKAD